MAKRPKLASKEDLWNDISPQKINRWAEHQLNLNADGGLIDREIPDDTYSVDPDPTANTMPFQLQATSTTNPTRPRTLAAGYDSVKKVLTVVFRDGTHYNYYDVPINIWDGFRNAESKGKFMISSGLDTWDSRGPADLAGLTEPERAKLGAATKMASQMQRSSGGRQQSAQGKQFE